MKKRGGVVQFVSKNMEQLTSVKYINLTKFILHLNLLNFDVSEFRCVPSVLKQAVVSVLSSFSTTISLCLSCSFLSLLSCSLLSLLSCSVSLCLSLSLDFDPGVIGLSVGSEHSRFYSMSP